MRLLLLLVITTLAACTSDTQQASDIDRLAELLEGIDTHASVDKPILGQ